MRVSVHQAQYLPWLGYFDKIAVSDVFVFLDRVQYKEREFQNRNRIRRQDGWMWLTVPVISSGGGRQAISDVMIDNGSDWQRKHQGSISTWYGGTAFFKEYFPFFKDVYSRQWDKLVDLNVHIIRFMLEALSINTPVVFESSLKTTRSSTGRIIEICRALKADVYLSGSGGKDYLDERLFAENGIRLEYQEFKHPVYAQRFQPFLPFMSTVDLLLNHGPASGEVLGGAKNP